MIGEYRKLPGSMRGFLYQSSVWAGPDHLLLVRGSRFREEYKRFYFRDVQAIAVARAPRFHVSAPMAFVAALLAAAVLTAIVRAYSGPVAYALAVFGLAALALSGVWIYVSAERSCRCRIYTAVSADELPSVYRMRTARRFLAVVEPLIARTQGAIEGAWAEAAEARIVGPAPAPMAPSAAVEPSPARLPRRAPASDLFLASMFADAAVKVAPLSAPLASWFPFAVELLTVVGAVAVIVQYNRGRLRAGMHRVAVASLIAFGILYYVQSISVGISASLTAAKTGKQTTAMAFPRSRLVEQTGAGMDAILIVVGLAISLRGDEGHRRGLMG